MDTHATGRILENKRLFAGLVLFVPAIIAILIEFGGTAYSAALQYQRDAILAGQAWRLLTGALVHMGWSHTLMNVVALTVIWGLFGQALASRAWLVITLGCALGVGAGLLLLSPEISRYVGLSGVLHGYFTAGAIAERRTHKRTTVVMLLLVSGKILWEQIAGPLPGSAETAGGNIIVDAHLYGAITGLVLGWFLSRERDPSKGA